MPYPFTSCDDLIWLMRSTIWAYRRQFVWANETAMQSAVQVRSELDNVWRVMRRCVQHGCHTSQTVLPGGLNAPRRAPKNVCKACLERCACADKETRMRCSNRRMRHGWICSLWRCRRKTPAVGESSPHRPTVLRNHSGSASYTAFR